MFTIRPGQLVVLSQAQVKRFEDWMLAHLNKFFSNESELAGESGLRETIQHGIKQAATYGIVSERDVCKYIDLMIVFGRDFDSDPQLPWASKALHEEFLEGHPTEKIERLCDLSMEHTKEAQPQTGAVQNVR